MKENTTLLSHAFFERSPITCARELVGCCLEWQGCAGVIVETEAYQAVGDAACHTHVRPSARRFIEEHEAGTAYVYLNYGVHWLFNFLVKGGGGDGFVLLRALEPLSGLARMRRRRGRDAEAELCSGPGKLTKALAIDGSLHGVPVLRSPRFSLCRLPDPHGSAPVACRRIGITKAVERKWRFVRARSSCLSVAPGGE